MSDAPADETTATTPPQDSNAPQAPAEAPAAPAAPESTPTTSEDASTPQEGAQEDSSSNDSTEKSTEDSSEGSEEKAAEPEVVNDANGQHVNMPDGSVVTTRSHTFPVTNTEQAQYELTHSGDQLRYPYKPGDAAYNAYSDPVIPNSHLARQVETEIASFGERVLKDVEAKISPMWEGLKGIFDGELKQAIATGGGEGKIVEP